MAWTMIFVTIGVASAVHQFMKLLDKLEERT